MKITDKRNRASDFDEIALGNVFLYQGSVYIKISEDTECLCENAWNCTENNMGHFLSIDEVECVDAELVIA